MTNKPKTYFIALDTDSYKLYEGVIPINLSWNDSISTWLKAVQEKLKNITDEDIVIGHSVGATIALLASPKGILNIYSPSPIFKESRVLLDNETMEKLGDKLDEVKNFSLKDVKIKPEVIYVGEKELDLMKETAKIICKYLGCDMKILPNKDHGDVINHSGISFDIIHK